MKSSRGYESKRDTSRLFPYHLLLLQQPPIDSNSNEGVVPDKDDVTSVHFKDVNFTYPARPDMQVEDL